MRSVGRQTKRYEGASKGAQIHEILFSAIWFLRPLDVTFTVTILQFFLLPTRLQKLTN